MSTPQSEPHAGAAATLDVLPLADLATLDDSQFEVRDGTVYLKGSVSQSSGAAAFPARETCLKTGARDMVAITFGPFGRLYSLATIHVSSTRATPYTLGYVDFPNGVRVLAEVRANAHGLPGCDAEVELRAEGNDWFVVTREAV